MKKSNIITILIILAVIALAIIIITRPKPNTDIELAKCIGSKSILYTQLGCSHCKIQEDMFGDNYQYLDVIDCFFEKDKCKEISVTPTWLINGQKYEGVQSIEKLKELTGC